MAVATKARPKAETTSANDQRRLLIEKRDQAKADWERRKQAANEKRQATKAAREAHEYGRLLVAEAAAEKELQVVTNYGGNAVKTANAELRLLMPPPIAAALEGIKVELHDLTFRIGKSFDTQPPAGTRDILLSRRNALERAQGELERLGMNVVDYEDDLARILKELHLLTPVGKAPVYPELATTSRY